MAVEALATAVGIAGSDVCDSKGEVGNVGTVTVRDVRFRPKADIR